MTSTISAASQEHLALAREIFHELSQPLTALQCTLELALRRDQSFEELRASIERSLENANSLRHRLALVRALDDASDPGDGSQRTDLYELLRELREDMLPLFDSAGRHFRLEPCRDAVVVRGDRTRLQQALFYFFEYLFRHSSENSVTAVRVFLNTAGAGELMVDAEASLPVSPPGRGAAEVRSCQVEMVRRSFRALGGDFVLLSQAVHDTLWRGTLPLA